MSEAQFPAELMATEAPVSTSSNEDKLIQPQANGIVVVGVQAPGCSLGDYSHLHDIFPLILDRFPQCELHVFIGIDRNHPSLQLMQEKIQRDFIDHQIECIAYTIAYTDEYGSYTPSDELIQYIEKLLISDRFIAAFSISYPCKEVSIACANQKKPEVRIFAHAIPIIDDQFPAININMGLSSGRFGVKLPAIIVDDNLDTRANVLVAIGESEPEFFRLLTGTAFSTTDFVANLAAAKLYLETHRYMYGYVQGNNDTILFIVAHVLKYIIQNNTIDRPCDFHLFKLTPELKNLILDALKKYGIAESAVEFINQASQQPNEVPEQSSTSSCKIRIFTYKIQDDEVWKLLYQLSKDGVGASGDNTVEQAYGSRSVPIIITIQGDRKCWVMDLRKIAESLQLATTTLINYFDFLLKYVTKTRDFNAEMAFYNEGASIYEVAQGLAEFLRNPNLQKEWECLHAELTSNLKNNFYNNFGLFLYLITPSSNYNDYIAAKNHIINMDKETLSSSVAAGE